MSVPHLLLLTRTPPGYSGVGGVFLHDLCLAYPRDSIICFGILPSGYQGVSFDLNWLPFDSALLPNVQKMRGLGRFGVRASQFISRRWIYSYNTQEIVARIVEFARRYDVDMIWAVLNDPIMIRITKKVVSELNVRFVTTIWDPPERQLMDQGYDRFLRRKLLYEFAELLKAAEKCGVASRPMGEYYQKIYGIEPVVLIQAFREGIAKPVLRENTNSDQLVIGFAGSLYASQEWNSLLNALNQVDWQVDGRRVRIRVLGTSLSVNTKSSANIEYLGWREQDEVVKILSEVDVTYLPYWFSPAYDLSVRLCFPNKLTTYLAAGKPIFYHGPGHASVAQFMSRFPIGISCYSLDAQEIIAALSQLVENLPFYTNAIDSSREALEDELGRDTFLSHFAHLVGVSEEDLLY
ncbi:MAG: hypothetical protein JXA33_22575 [Anaerolineae bacterium]|nr:hypothetical protein [Anaerolineae bacterium]